MDEQVIYRPMTEADIPAVLGLQADSALSPWTEAGYKEALNDPSTMANSAEIDEKIVGFMIGRLITSESLFEILNITVNSTHRKRQIGEGLLLSIFSRLDPEISRIWLEVRVGNQAAIAFYKKHGFEIVGQRNNFYSNPAEDALLMQKQMP